MSSSGNDSVSSQLSGPGNDVDEYLRALLPELCAPSASPINSAIASAHGAGFMFRTLALHRQRALDLVLMDAPEHAERASLDDVVTLQAADVLAVLIPLLEVVPDFASSLAWMQDQLDLALRQDRVFSVDTARQGESEEIVRKHGRAAVGKAQVSLEQIGDLLNPIVRAVVGVLEDPLIQAHFHHCRTELAKASVAPTSWSVPVSTSREES